MLQLTMILLVIVALAGLLITRKHKGVRVNLMRLSAVVLSLCFVGAGASMIPEPLTADNGVQYANFIKVDVTETEELSAQPLQAFQDGSYILIEEAKDGQYVHFILEAEGVEKRVPAAEIVFSHPESFGYDTPVLRYGRAYLEYNKLITFLDQRWDFIHIVAAPESFGIWAG